MHIHNDNPPIYQVLVLPSQFPWASLWRSPMLARDPAMELYAIHANDIYLGNTSSVLLTKHGVIVAQSNQS